MIWAFAPAQGSTTACVFCDDRAEYVALVAGSPLVFDGQPAHVRAEGCNPGRLFVRFEFEQPFLAPPRRLRFEDPALAVAVAELGWTTFEGQLYRAILEPPSTVTLDAVFASAPPPQYHGRTWLEEDGAPDTTFLREALADGIARVSP